MGVSVPSGSTRTQIPSVESWWGASSRRPFCSRTAWPSSTGESPGPMSTGTRAIPALRGVFQAQVWGRPEPVYSRRVPLASFSAPTRVTQP